MFIKKILKCENFKLIYNIKYKKNLYICIHFNIKKSLIILKDPQTSSNAKRGPPHQSELAQISKIYKIFFP